MRLPPNRVRHRGPILILSAAITLAATLAASQPFPVLTESDAISRALGDPDFTGAADARRQAAQADAEALARRSNPTVSVSRGEISGAAQDEVEWEVGVVQPFDLTGRRAALRGAAIAETRAVDAEMRRRVDERRAEVRRAFATCALASEEAAARRAFVRRLGEAERIVSQRTGAGDTAVYDLRRVRVEARAAAAAADIADGETAAACTALEHLTGLAGARPAQGLAPPAIVPANAAPRADLVARERRVEAAAQTLQAAQRSRWPEIEVGLGWRRLEVGGFEADGPQVSVGAAIPLFDRGEARVRAASARERAEAADLALARRKAEAEVAAATARAAAAAQAARTARGAREDATRLGTIAEAAYEAGETGVTELVDAYRAAHEAELSTLELTGRAILAAIELELAQGGPNP